MTRDDLKNRLRFLTGDLEWIESFLTDVDKYSESLAAAKPLVVGRSEQLSCGCTPIQRTMITFTDDGDYCGGCGKLIPTT